MRGVGQQSSYSPLPQQSMGAPSGASKAPNAVNIKGRTLDQLVEDFAKATGSDEAELRIVHDEGNVHFIVPSSKDGSPSLWTKFKAALSDLPLLKNVASIRAAKLEVASRPLECDDVLLRTGISHAVDRTERAQKFDQFKFGNTFFDEADAQLRAQPLTKRHVVQVMTSAMNGINQRREWVDSRAQTTLAAVPRESAIQTRKPASRNTADRNHALFAECEKTVAERIPVSDRARIKDAAQALYAQTQSFLVSKGAWPVKDMEDIQGIVATLDIRNRDD